MHRHDALTAGQVRLLHLIVQNLLLALGYGALGWAALSLSLPPGYSLPFFPAAGLALGAVLARGRQLLPGVALGSAIVQLVVGRDAGLDPVSPAALVMVPATAALQAAVGAALMRRLVGYPTPLDSPRDIVRFLGIVAPLGCLVAASLAVPTLAGLGMLSMENLPIHWAVWWVGDTIGVTTMAPIVLAFIGWPREDWRPRVLTLVVPLGIASVLLFTTLWHLRTSDAIRSETEFSRAAASLAHQLESRLESQIEMLRSAQRLLSVSGKVNRDEWHDYVVPWFERHPGTLNFTWNPLVPADGRDAFVASVRAEGFPDFDILDRAGNGRVVVANRPRQGIYLPITYVEPFAANGKVFGLDPLSVDHSAAAIWATLADGQPRATPPFRLTQETGEQKGVVVYQGVRKELGDEVETIGMVSTALRVDDLVGAALPGATSEGIELCLLDVSQPSQPMLLSSEPACLDRNWNKRRIGMQVPLAVAGRAWQVRLRTAPGFEFTTAGAASWITILAGLAAITLLGAFLLLTTGRTRRIQELVDLRTGELAAASRRLLEQQGALAEAQRIAGLGSWQLASDGKTLNCSDECRRVLSLPARDPLSLDDMVAGVLPENQPALTQAIDKALAALSHLPHSRQSLDCTVRDRHGNLRVVNVLVDGSRSLDGGRTLRGTVQDVTAARDTEARIQRLADFDGLTGLPNRNFWTSRARIAIASARRHGEMLAVLFIDLDNFKNVNDSLGHQTGDRMLAVVAERLASALREEDLLARLGGDEFVALLPNLEHPDDAAAVASKLLALREHPIVIDDHSLPLSMSIGIARFPDDGADVDTLLRNADMAMYGAKGAGRNALQHFVPEMNARAFERLQLDNALRHALQQDQFFLVYQPQVDVDRDRIVGYEALLRWRHPELGLVSPERFIPAAEVSGLIVPIGDWVMTTAFRRQVELREAGGTCTMAVNISAIQFRRDDFVHRVEQVMAATGVTAAEIEFEITESALMDPTPELLQRLDRLRALGIRLALDDFGTGYSSLSYLKRLPIQSLKIDRSFVSDLPGDAEDAAIASATLSMASDLGVEVVAEGVETVAQRDFLHQRGCRLMQGYLFSRPLPSDALTPDARIAAAG